MKQTIKLFLTSIVATFLVAGLISIYPVNVFSQSAQAPKTGNHFIVIIRDSTIMKKRQGLNKIRKTLPDLLFDSELPFIERTGIVTYQSRAQLTNLPQYYPQHDHLSVVFADIHKNARLPSRCRTTIDFSAKEEHFFQWQPVAQHQNKTAFENALRKWMKDRCRARGYTFSSVLAETTILPYVQRQLEQQGKGHQLFAKTILIVVDNGATFGGISPSKELASLSKQGVADIDSVSEVIDQVTRAFHFVGSEQWVFTINDDTAGNFKQGAFPNDPHLIRYRIAEIEPLDANEHNLIDYKKEIRLDRIAVSNNRLELLPEIPLRILPSKRVRPFEITLAFANTQDDGAWQVGNYEFPTQSNPKTVTIPACSEDLTKPACYSQANGLFIPSLLKLVHGDVHLNAQASDLTQGKLFFAVKFLYNGGRLTDGSPIYSHHYLDTLDKGWKTIELIPVPPQTVKAESYDNQLFFSKIRLDNAGLTEQYTLQDTQGLRQDTALMRIENDRNTQKRVHDAGEQIREIQKIFTGVAGLGLLLLILYAFFYYHRFKPTLQWQPARKISLDFNQQPGAKLLVGTLIVNNQTRLPGLNKQAEFSLDYSDLTAKGLKLADIDKKALGFVDIKDNNKLVSQQSRLVNHNTPVQIFLATDAIEDFETDEPISTESHKIFFTRRGDNISISVQMHYRHYWIKRQIPKDLDFELELIPENPKPPKVEYINYYPKEQNKSQRCVFSAKPEERERPIGVFIFYSQAQHQFAKDFAGHFYLAGYDKHKLPLTKGALKLQGEQNVIVPAHDKYGKKGQTKKLAVIVCDGDIIRNPKEPGGVAYTYELKGHYDLNNSQAGPYHFTLYRDPRQADIFLDVLQFKNTYQIFWKEEEQSNTYQPHPVFKKGIKADSATKVDFAADTEPLPNDLFELAPYLIKFDENSSPTKLFEIWFANDGFSNDEIFTAIVKYEVILTDSVQENIILQSDYQWKELIHLGTGSTATVYKGGRSIQVHERENPKKLGFLMDTRIIKAIKNGRVGTNEKLDAHPLDISRSDSSSDKRYTINGNISLEVYLELKLGEEGKQARREHNLCVKIPLGLEKLPHRDWLCLDFGTSAIVAAIGTPHHEEPKLLPLQKLDEDENPALNIADYNENIETGTPFLPSYVACDADLRQGSKTNEIIRKGYPRYQPASLEPGEPDFISLPATRLRLYNFPGRVIYSLKGWLAQPDERLELKSEITFEENGESFTRKSLPLDKVITSGFAALAEGYLTYFDEVKQGGQIVLSHPNTFTIFHQRKLHDIAWNALNQPLGIGLKERLQLISESDAVAFSYCRQRQSNNEYITKKDERLLVYDFGAGTLDLSLISIHWSEDGTYPETWQVENRLGVSIAGNYLDSLLARLIDELLRNDEILNSEIFEYRYPLVARKLKGYEGDETEQNNHRQTIYQLWEAIRVAKQGSTHHQAWDGQSHFRIKMGEWGEISTIMNISKEDIETVKMALAETNTENTENGAFLEIKGDSIWFNIPAEQVHHYKPLQEFITFVTETVIDELLDAAEITMDGHPLTSIEEKRAQVNTLVISGRGALWPGLRERAIQRFPNLDEQPKLADSQQVKNAVVQGAVAWQLFADFVQIKEPQCQSQLAVLCLPSQRFVPESQWQNGTSVNLKGASSFQLMEVGIKNPKLEDLQPKSLRRYFYATLGELLVNPMWTEDKQLYLKRTNEDDIKGQTIVVLSNSLGEEKEYKMAGSVGGKSIERPWPVGNVLLKPED